MVVRVKWYPLPDTRQSLVKCCLPAVPSTPVISIFFFFFKDYLQNVLFSQALSVISHRERDTQDHFFLICLCPSFAHVAWHTYVRQWWHDHTELRMVLVTELTFCCKLSTSRSWTLICLLSGPPDSLRESMSAGLLRGLKMLHQIIPGLDFRAAGAGVREMQR